MKDLRAAIRTVPDFPKAGIQFRDVTTLLLDADAFGAAVARLAAVEGEFDQVAGIEARGFVFGAAVARERGLGFLPLRKPGKLPGATVGESYKLEYGEDALHAPHGLVKPGARVLLVDDLIATGGTACAAVRLLRRIGCTVAAAAFVVDLPDLGGAERLRAMSVSVSCLTAFSGD